MLEKEIDRRMCAMVRKCGGLTYKFVSPNNPGVPDRVVITPTGGVWFVEVKTVSGKLSKIQEWQISELRKRKTNVRVVWGLEGAIDFVREVMPVGV